MTKIGYGRVSTRDQDHTAQHRRLTEAGCDKIYVEKASGRLASRPELDKALAYPVRGDTFIVTKLDRLGRSVKNLADTGEKLKERGVIGRARSEHRHLYRGRSILYNTLANMAEFEADFELRAHSLMG